MKISRTHWVLLALAAVALIAMAFDASAVGLLVAPAAAVTLDDIKDLPELARRMKQATDEASDKTGELNQRMHDLERTVVKGLKSATESSEAPSLDLSDLVADPAFQRIKSDSRGTAHGFELGAISIKALVNLGDPNSLNDGYPAPATRLPGRLASPLAPLRLINVLPFRPVDSNKIEYVQLSSSGNADVQAEEGAEKAEVEFAGELVTASIATIAAHTTASAQVLDDAEGLQALIQRVLVYKVLTKVEEQLTTGSGTGSNVDGLYTRATALSTGQDGVPERIGQGLTTMEIAGYSPNLILMNPNDWFEVSILKDADGNYIYGNPASPAAPTLWNRPVVISPKIPQGHALIGDTSQVTVLDRMAPTVFISRDHKDYRTRNLVLILVEARVGLELYDTAGFRKIDLGASG